MRRAESIKILRRAIEGGLLDDLGWRWWWVLDRTPDLFVETRERLAGVAPECYFKTKWRAPKPTHRDVLRRAAEGGYFAGCGTVEVNEKASALLGRPARLDYSGRFKPWEWLVDYGKKETP